MLRQEKTPACDRGVRSFWRNHSSPAVLVIGISLDSFETPAIALDPFEPTNRASSAQYKDPRQLLRDLAGQATAVSLPGPAGQLQSALSGQGISVGDDTGSVSIGPDGSLGINKGNWRASVGFGHDPSIQVGFNLGGREQRSTQGFTGLVEDTQPQGQDRPEPTPSEFLNNHLGQLRERIKDPYWYRP
jgi:hypothetical protein